MFAEPMLFYSKRKNKTLSLKQNLAVSNNAARFLLARSHPSNRTDPLDPIEGSGCGEQGEAPQYLSVRALPRFSLTVVGKRLTIKNIH